MPIDQILWYIDYFLVMQSLNFSHALLELSDAKEEGIEIRILALFRLKFLREVTKERDAQTKDLESY